jgi:tetratricopeptide (TPR) repeat protein
MILAMLVLLPLSLLLALFPQQTGDVAARFDRAVQFQRAGELEQAAEQYRQLLKLAPKYAEAQANYGAVLARLGRYPEAVSAYETALSLDPTLTPVMLNLAIAHYRVGEFARAADVLDRFLAASPDNLQARHLLGISLVELGKDAAALEHLERSLAAASIDVTATYYLGLAYLRLQRHELSEVIARLKQTREGSPLANMLQAQEYLERFEFNLAAQKLEEAARVSSDLPKLQGLLGLCYLKMGRTEDAVVAFERELSRAPGEFFVLYYLGYAQEKLGNLNNARQRVEAALRVEPESTEANKLHGKILFKQGQITAALTAVEKAVKHDPLDAENRYLRARIFQRLGRGQEAKREFAEVEQLKEKERSRGSNPLSPK